MFLHRGQEGHRDGVQGAQLRRRLPRWGGDCRPTLCGTTLKRFHGSDLALLKIDFRNAFNEVGRPHFVSEACSMFPAMSSWTDWCYGTPTMLLYDHKHIIESEAGVQQGDPLGPLYFCCGIMPWLMTSMRSTPSTTSGTWTTAASWLTSRPCSSVLWDLLKSSWSSAWFAPPTRRSASGPGSIPRVL